MNTTETDTATALPAAWYCDPSGRHERRWWDGAGWTDRVADGDEESSDPPVRSRPTQSPMTDTAAEPDEPDEDHPDEHARAGFVGVGPARVPVAERPSTAPLAGRGPGRRGVVAVLVGGAVVVAGLLWGLANHRSADRWQDRGEALQEELATRSRYTDTLEDALSQAGRGTRTADGQASFAELEQAAVDTVDQLDRCGADLNRVLRFLATEPGDPTSLIERANGSCGAAGLNGATLIALLDRLTEP